ncbi:MAG: QueT transporter family protein [Candidatus Verstraetearchaeota archaeon]|nr:QueT transporter family protein [Candidatus Verstraetearchaeota archaeon]
MPTPSKARAVVKTAIIAATYAALTFSLAPLSFGEVQVRVANALIGLVPLVGMPGVVGISLGVLIGNLASPLGPLDLLSAVPTFASLLILLRLKRVSVLAGLACYTAILSAWVGFLLNHLLGLPFVIVFAYLIVGIGIATVGLGYLLYASLKMVLRDSGGGRADRKAEHEGKK